MVSIVDIINWDCHGLGHTMVMARAIYSIGHGARQFLPPGLEGCTADCQSRAEDCVSTIPSGSSHSRKLLPITRFVANNVGGAEVSMLAAAVYNMLDFQSMHGRSRAHDVYETTYKREHHAFGRVPVVIHLCDVLQLPPTAGTGFIADGN